MPAAAAAAALLLLLLLLPAPQPPGWLRCTVVERSQSHARPAADG